MPPASAAWPPVLARRRDPRSGCSEPWATESRRQRRAPRSWAEHPDRSAWRWVSIVGAALPTRIGSRGLHCPAARRHAASCRDSPAGRGPSATAGSCFRRYGVADTDGAQPGGGEALGDGSDSRDDPGPPRVDREPLNYPLTGPARPVFERQPQSERWQCGGEAEKSLRSPAGRTVARRDQGLGRRETGLTLPAGRPLRKLTGCGRVVLGGAPRSRGPSARSTGGP